MPPGVLFAVYDSKTGNPDYIPPEYSDVPGLLDDLIEYVNTTDDKSIDCCSSCTLSIGNYSSI